MKRITEILLKVGVVCRELKKVDLHTRKKIECYFGYNIKSEYCIVFYIDRKSRFLIKDVDELEMFVLSVRQNKIKNKKKILILKTAPMCSKAKEKLHQLGWRIL